MTHADWSPGQKLAYAAITFAGTALVMWAIGVWIAEPVGRWGGELSTRFPPWVTFAFAAAIFPLWYGLWWYFYGRHGAKLIERPEYLHFYGPMAVLIGGILILSGLAAIVSFFRHGTL